VEVRNAGGAAAEVPVTVRSGTLTATERLRVPGGGTASRPPQASTKTNETDGRSHSRAGELEVAFCNDEGIAREGTADASGSKREASVQRNARDSGDA